MPVELRRQVALGVGLALAAVPHVGDPLVEDGEPFADERRQPVERRLGRVQLDAALLGLATGLDRPGQALVDLGEAAAQERVPIGEGGAPLVDVGAPVRHLPARSSSRWRASAMAWARWRSASSSASSAAGRRRARRPARGRAPAARRCRRPARPAGRARRACRRGRRRRARRPGWRRRACAAGGRVPSPHRPRRCGPAASAAAARGGRPRRRRRPRRRPTPAHVPRRTQHRSRPSCRWTPSTRRGRTARRCG